VHLLCYCLYIFNLWMFFYKSCKWLWEAMCSNKSRFLTLMTTVIFGRGWWGMRAKLHGDTTENTHIYMCGHWVWPPSDWNSPIQFQSHFQAETRTVRISQESPCKGVTALVQFWGKVYWWVDYRVAIGAKQYEAPVSYTVTYILKTSSSWE
jgi:hypothetical protein